MPRNEFRVYVGSLPPDVSTKDIEELFSRYGKVAYVDLKDRRGHTFVFVEFEDPRDAEDAVSEVHGYYYDGYRLSVEFPRWGKIPRKSGDRGGDGRRSGAKPRRSQFRVMVSGLPLSGSWQDLKDHMRLAGQVCFANVSKDGSGVVEYVYPEDMKHAVKTLDDSKFRSHEGETSYIRVKEDYRVSGK